MSRVTSLPTGFLSKKEINEAIWEGSILGDDASAIAALHRLIEDLQEKSNDEWGDENSGVTKNDIREYERHYQQKTLEGDLAWAEVFAQGARDKIGHARRSVFKDKDRGPDLAYLMQGPVGDCYFLAALGSLIARDASALTRMITENVTAGRVASYTVTFPGKLGIVTVPAPTDGEIARYSSAGDDGLWLVVMEKAYAAARSRTKNPDIQEEIGEGGYLSTGLSAFASGGVDTDFLSLTRKRKTVKKLDAAFGRSAGNESGRKRLVTAAIWRENSYGLPNRHAYSIIGWDGTFLEIRNPWGYNPRPRDSSAKVLTGVDGKDPYKTGVFKLSIDEFHEVFGEIAYEE